MYKEIENGQLVFSLYRGFKKVSIVVPSRRVITRYQLAQAVLGIFYFPVFVISVIMESILLGVSAFSLLLLISSKFTEHVISKYPKTDQAVSRSEYLGELGGSIGWGALVFALLSFLALFAVVANELVFSNGGWFEVLALFLFSYVICFYILVAVRKLTHKEN